MICVLKGKLAVTFSLYNRSRCHNC